MRNSKGVQVAAWSQEIRDFSTEKKSCNVQTFYQKDKFKKIILSSENEKGETKYFFFSL